MNTEKFKEIYNLSRNGCNHFIRHPLCRRLIYSDGVGELADEGCHWLLDIIGTEVIDAMKGAEALGIIKVNVSNSQAVIVLELDDDAPAAWRREIEYTDMPEGEWVFFMNDDAGDSQQFSLILPSEN